MISEHLLHRIEAADIAHARAHYAMLTEDEIQERQYRSCDLNGTWVLAETRNGKRVGRITGLGLTTPTDSGTLEIALEWLRAEQSKTIRVHVAPTPENAQMVDWLTTAGFKRAMRIHQWYIRTDKPVEPVVTRRRGKTYDNDYSIREIGPEMAGVFVRIVAINYRFKPGTDLGWWERQIGSPGNAAFLAFDGDEPIGTGSMQGDGEICALGYGTTLKTYRKRGLQNAMIAARLRKAREVGYSLATASTFGTDQSSRNLRRQGFELAGQVDLFSK